MMDQQVQVGFIDSEHVPPDAWRFLQEPLPGHRWLLTRQHKVWRPPTDVYETDSHVIVKVEIAGMREEDFGVSLNAQVLLISGVRSDPAEKLAYQQMEIPYGQFETEVYIPWTVDEDAIKANYQDGFLSVLLPKATPRRVPVVQKSGGQA
jgi:HSP20 family protein